MRQFFSKFYPQLILILLPIFFFYPIFQGYVIFTGQSFNNEFYPWKDLPSSNSTLPWSVEKFYGSDPMTAHYPWKLIGIEMMKKGEWPLWNPYSLAGAPLLANNQSALLDPLNIFYFMVNFTSAWNINIVLQIILTGLFCYYLLLDYKLSKFSSLWGGMIYAWNGYLANYLHIQVIGHVLIWLPLSILMLRKINREERWAHFLLLVFSITAILFSGYLQTAVYALLMIFLFCIVTCWKKIFILTLAFITSIGLSAVQIFPSLEFISKSQRSAQIFYDTFSFLAQPGQLIRLLMPRFFGHPNSENWWGGILQRDHSYIGVLGIIFVLAGIWVVLKFKNRDFKSWLFLLTFFIVLTVESPLTRFIYNLPLPLLNSVTPSRGLGMIVFPLAVLSALGIEHFSLESKKLGRVALVIVSLLMSIAFISTMYTQINFSMAQNILQSSRQSFIFFSSFSLIFILLTACYLKKWLPTFLILLLLFTVQTADLLKENKFFTRLFASPQQLYPQTELTDFLTAHSTDRFLSLDLWILIPNSFMPYHLYTITAYDALHLKNSSQFVESIFKNIPQTYSFDPRSIRFSNLNTNLASMLNIGYILSLSELEKGGLKLTGKIGSVFVYKNPGVLQYGFLVPDIKISDEEQQFSSILDQSTDFSKTIFLSEKPIDNPGPSGKAQLLYRGNRFSKWLISVQNSQMLFIPETYDSGWQAFIDGEETKVYQANGAFQAVAIPSGKHIVKLFYNPLSFQIGLFISGITLLLLLLLTVLRPGFFPKNKPR